MENVAMERVKKKIEEGVYLDPSRMDDYKLYRKIVWKYTNKQKIEVLKNFDKRGRADLKNDAYHLDHRFSIYEGFKNNIPSYIIGNIGNLEFIPHYENSKKQGKCSITKEELFRLVIDKSGELLETP